MKRIRRAAGFAALKGFRTMIQTLAAVATAVPFVANFEDLKVAAAVSFWGAVGAGVAGVTAFLQNFAEHLEAFSGVEADHEVPREVPH